jgi:hypothetical protein
MDGFHGILPDSMQIVYLIFSHIRELFESRHTGTQDSPLGWTRKTVQKNCYIHNDFLIPGNNIT